MAFSETIRIVIAPSYPPPLRELTDPLAAIETEAEIPIMFRSGEAVSVIFLGMKQCLF